MNLRDQQEFLRTFHNMCLAITAQKGPDYAPDGIPLLDMLATCVDANVSIPQGLWVFFRKHLSAIRKHFFLGQPLTSETIDSRLADAANYFGFLAFWETHKLDLLAAWTRHWMAQSCECESGAVDPLTGTHQPCQKCETLRWLAKQVSSVDSGLTLSGLTQRAPA